MKRAKSAYAVNLALLVFFIFTLVLPLGRMLYTITTVDVTRILTSRRFVTALQNSVISASLSTLIAVFLAFVMAWTIARANIRFKQTFVVLFMLPMLVPPMSHGIGLIVLLGQNGIVTNLLGMDASIYGLVGITVGSVMFSFPVAFIMIYDILRYEDQSPYEAASVLGIPKPSQFANIMFPYLRRPFIAVVFAVFALVFTDFGIPVMVGGRFITLPVVMYQDVIGRIDFGFGSVIGTVLLVPALVAFFFDMANKDKGNTVFVIKKQDAHKNRLVETISYIVCVLVSLVVLLPILSFCLLTFVERYPINMAPTLGNIARAFNMRAGKFLANSLVIAASVSVTGTAISFVFAYFTARMKSHMSRALHFICVAALPIPGLVLGLSYAMFFSGSLIHGTIVILVMVNFVHFFSSPYLMMYNTLEKINENIEDVGATLGIGRLRAAVGIILPQCKATIIDMTTFFFVNCMITISAVSFLFNTNTRPLSLLIITFEANRLMEGAAFVSLLILAANISQKILANIAKRLLKAGG